MPQESKDEQQQKETDVLTIDVYTYIYLVKEEPGRVESDVDNPKEELQDVTLTTTTNEQHTEVTVMETTAEHPEVTIDPEPKLQSILKPQLRWKKRNPALQLLKLINK